MSAKKDRSGGVRHMNPQQVFAVLVCMLTGFMSPFMSSSLNLCIPAMSTEFNCGATAVTWVITSYTLATAMFSIPLGHVADVKGRRLMLIIGTVFFTISSAACALAPNIEFLIGARFAMAVSGDAILAANVALMLLAFPPEHKGRMLGLYGTVVGVGLTMGPVIGGVLCDLLSWRYVFVTGVVVGAFCSYLSVFRIEKDVPGEQTQPFDHVGSALFMVSLFVLMFGLSEWTAISWAPICFGVGVLLVGVFVAHEWRCEAPVMQVRLFVESALYGRANFASLLKTAAFFAVGYTMAIYLEVVQGLDAATASLVMLAQPAIQGLLSPFAGSMADRMRPAMVSAFGVIIVTASLFGLSFVEQGLTLWQVVALLFAIGFGNAFFVAPNQSVVMSCVGPESYSEANATITAMRGIGQSLSIVIVGLVLSITVGNTVLAQIPAADLTHAISVIMLIGGFIGIAAVLCTIELPKRAHAKEER